MSIQVAEGIEGALFGAMLGSGGQVLTLSASSARCTVLSEGLYKLCATEACWVRQGTSSVAAVEATAPCELIPAGAIRYFPVTASAINGYVAAIQNGGAGGKVSITRADRR